MEHDRLNELVEEGMEPLIDELRREEEGIMRADRALNGARHLFWIG